MSDAKFTAVWVSHSSMGDFLKCPRAYYLNNVYKDPATRRKISLINPQLALGQAVHNTVEALVNYRAEDRVEQPLLDWFEEEWKKVSGKRGGFTDEQYEEEVKERGRQMVKHVIKNPGPLVNKTVKLPDHPDGPSGLPRMQLSDEENIILCGKVDWLEYLPESDALHVIDFKTGKTQERADSLQLPIYLLLIVNLQRRKVERASYWYLDDGIEERMVEKELPNYEEAHARVLETARQVKAAREAGEFSCPRGGNCFACKPLEQIVAGEAEYVGVNEMNQDTYMIPPDRT